MLSYELCRDGAIDWQGWEFWVYVYVYATKAKENRLEAKFEDSAGDESLQGPAFCKRVLGPSTVVPLYSHFTSKQSCPPDLAVNKRTRNENDAPAEMRTMYL
jgi:hypothetical protein